MVYMAEGGDLRFHVCALETDERSFIAHLVAVVRRGEYCQNSASLLILVSILLYFVTPYKQL